ncbi:MULTISPECIES: hypothetical protein [Nocardia]|uniref:hypothetical protein n=1 Tax=Nocardia TaxID=1817 RepID=UPI000D69362F|nr:MULTISPECIES: hypothetical protein [Nocardia]
MFAVEAAGTRTELTDRLDPRAKEVLELAVEQLHTQGYGGTYVRWYCEGYVEGYVRGYAEALIELLTAKFGTLSPATIHTIQIEGIPELRTWTTRVLTATTLDEIFA